MATSLQRKTGNPAPIKADGFPAITDAIAVPMEYDVLATTVRTSASKTQNYASNDNLRIFGSDGRLYTLAAWNALFVQAGYDTKQMAVAPDGFAFRKKDGSWEVIYWESFSGRLYRIDGSALLEDRCLPHSPYNTLMAITVPINGTDVTTGKAWRVTSYTDAAGDLGEPGKQYWALYTENTGKTFYIPQSYGGYVQAQGDSSNFEQWTDYVLTMVEWYRHRFALNSGVTVSEGAVSATVRIGTEGSGSTVPPVGDDMYFWIEEVGDSGSHTMKPTGLLAKYNINNLHGGSATGGLTETLRTTLFDRQRAAGINMNDTGVNSATRGIKAPGQKGAEAVAVDGVWYITTPFITQAAQITSSPQNVVADAPAVSYVSSRGLHLPSQESLERWFFNLTLVNAMRSYLNTVEARGLRVETPGSSWVAGRQSASSAWYVYPSGGYRAYAFTYIRCRVIPASGL